MSALFRAEGQWAVFMALAAAGVAAGLVRDALFACMGPMEAGRGLRAVCAALAGACAAVCAGAACLFATGGEPRAYMLIALAAGAALYRLTLGALFRRLRARFRRALARAGAFARQNALCGKMFR